MKFYVIKNSLYHSCSNDFFVGYYKKIESNLLKCEYCDLTLPSYLTFGFDYQSGTEFIWPIKARPTYPISEVKKLYEVHL